ncbi:VOC family protein [Neopusillimonas maritima]|uniref:Glyoxalase n=1 Tax=Neopusillimonas maritima TaxID=2026239 RepID=A0ABX9MT91_9BURK|nr:VOC family protein [Neopusillimonas maritima]RII82182.1 glyoxalase [Neopusillimonas maritima]
MMKVIGIDEITYGANDFDTCKKFFSDWGLSLTNESASKLVFSTLNGCRVNVVREDDTAYPEPIESGPTLREVVWGVSSPDVVAEFAQRLATVAGYRNENGRVSCIDPTGMLVSFQLTQKKDVEVECGESNTWNSKPRRNAPSPIYDRAYPIEVGHVVFFVKDLEAVEKFYVENFGFVPSDRYPGRGVFLRCDPDGGHHDLFLLQTPDKKVGLNHVAFAVRDIHEVFGGGLHFDRCGWKTQLGPGRHPISSAYFWYFVNPAGGLIEYYADEDQLDENWEPREFEPAPTRFAEWAVDGGLDGHTRRQKNTEAPEGKFLTDRK